MIRPSDILWNFRRLARELRDAYRGYITTRRCWLCPQLFVDEGYALCSDCTRHVKSVLYHGKDPFATSNHKSDINPEVAQ